MSRSADLVVVWGNCQAAPVAELLREPLSRVGLRVVTVPAVYLVDEAQLARVHELVARCAVLISQPVGDDYRYSGCSTAALASRLPQAGRLVTFPVIFHVGAFPHQVHAHGGDGVRVDAPLTDYHDLRALVAAARGLTTAQAVRWWPAPNPGTVSEIAQASRARLQRRERELDVQIADWLDAPDTLWTMTHPGNRVLGDVAGRLLAALRVKDAPTLPAREFLGERRAPIEAAVAHAHGWSEAEVRPAWVIRGREYPLPEVVAAHLALYERRPDIVADSLVRHETRLGQLGLSP